MDTITSHLKSGAELEQREISIAAEFLLDDRADVTRKAEFLTALADKGETPAEIAGFVQEFLKVAVDPKIEKLSLEGPTVDVCGTGGDKLDLFNVSTTSLFVIAAGGANVVKHGNRGITSKSGGADVLEELGVRLDLTPEEFRKCLKSSGVGFLFAQAYHPAFKAVAPVRQELAKQGKRTIFNLIGPLLNPAKPDCQLVGVWDPQWVPAFADILQRLGRESAWVVNGQTSDGRGMDEVSLCGPTTICKSGSMQAAEDEEISPADFGMDVVDLDELKGGDAKENAEILKSILNGEEMGAKREIVLLNAAAGLACAGLADHMEDGVQLAEDLIDSGEAMQKLEDFIECSR